MIPLVRALCEELAAAGVTYCHWKSTTFLDRSGSGENDLDLLVLRSDADRCEAVLRRLAFKEAVAPRPLPGIVDYYGYDADAARIVHAHVHYRLVVGDDLTKNYVLPLEDAFLAGASARGGTFPVPEPELELIALVLRLMLKHATWDAIVTRRGKVPDSARAELDDLRTRSDRRRLEELLERELPFVGAALFAECEAALVSRRSAWTRARVARRLLARLAPLARRPQLADVMLKTGRLLAAYLSRSQRGKRLARGGAVVAIVGADGAGKSTAVEEIAGWLGRTVSVRRVHLGKPPPSLRSRVLRTALRGTGALSRGRGHAGDGPVSRLEASVAVALARDRLAAHTAARRFALEGGVAICDRYPLPQLSLMDAPRLSGAAGVHQRAARRERRFYDAMLPPDVLVVLRVDPEVAVARRSDEHPDFVRARNREVWEADWSTSTARVVDAGRPLAEVSADIKTIVWSQL